jgi:DNA-binding transcriptional regulator YdaS (Cro superfamily)
MTPAPDLPGVVKLRAYVAANFDSQKAFCQHAGFSGPFYSQMLSGYRQITSLDVAARLELATGGGVTMRDFLPEDMRKALDARRQGQTDAD